MKVGALSKRKFRDALVERCGGCAVQHDGWPCGTCFGKFSSRWEAWASVLAYRGDYEDHRTKDGYKMAYDIKYKPDGTFSHHEFRTLTEEQIKAEIQKLAKELGL